MAKEYQKISTYKTTPGILLKIMTDPAYEIAQAKNTGSIKASVNEISRTEKQLVYEVHSTEYARGLTGVDKSKTEISLTTFTWDLIALKAFWKYAGHNAFRIDMSGTHTISAAGNQTQLTSIFRVDVGIPLLGNKIAGLVLKEIDQTWPAFQKTVEEFIRSHSGS